MQTEYLVEMYTQILVINQAKVLKRQVDTHHSQCWTGPMIILGSGAETQHHFL